MRAAQNSEDRVLEGALSRLESRHFQKTWKPWSIIAARKENRAVLKQGAMLFALRAADDLCSADHKIAGSNVEKAKCFLCIWLGGTRRDVRGHTETSQRLRDQPMQAA